MRNFLNISDLSSGELRVILDEAKARKSRKTTAMGANTFVPYMVEADTNT